VVKSARPLPAPLHERVTVVRVDATVAGSARSLADALAATFAPDHHGGEPPRALDAAAILAGARRLAAAAQEQRVAARAAALAHRRELASRRTELLERAEWCESAGADVRALIAATEDAAARVAEARAVLEAATARRDRVAEQRAAAAAAVEEARLELESLDGAAMDETGVRREIEAATRVERDTAATLAAAEAEVADLEARLAEVDAAHREVADALAELQAELERPDLAEREAAVREKFAVYEDLASRAGVDPGATALADAIRRIDEELRELRRRTPEPPTDADLEQAEADVAEARRSLDNVRATAGAFHGPPPPWWEELTRLHAEVVDAETAVEVSTLRRGAARRRYEEAVAAERARLDELGFATYYDAFMSGGRLPEERARDEAAIEEATASLAAAERRLERLRADLVHGAPVVERLAERERLVDLATGLLGIDPGDRTLELLDEHPAVPPMVIGDLADTLRAAGVPTAGIGVGAAARQWLAARDAARDPARRRELERRLADLDAQRRSIEQALAPARAVAERAARDATDARRTVTALEGELAARAGDDGKLLERAAAARSLRDQVETLEARLAEAEAEAQEAWAAAAEAVSAAETEQQRVERDLADLRRRAARAAGDLSPEHRPAFDPLTGLVALGGALRAEAGELSDRLAEADAAVAAADASVAAGPADPTVEDLERALAAAVEEAPAPAVLAEPLRGLPADAVDPLLDILLQASARHPLVVVTSDLTVVGWAIGLPSETCSLVPARSVEALLDTATHHARD
jgi:chromosome segregation ATPase